MMVIHLCISILSAWLTYSLIKRPGISPTRASALLSLVGVGALFAIHQFYAFDFEPLAILLFGASFVGMCSHKVVSGWEVVVGAVVFALVYNCVVPSLSGLGGALGVSAFVSIMLSRGLSRLFQLKPPSNFT